MYDVKSRAAKLTRVWRRGKLTAVFAAIAAAVSLVALTASVSPGSAQLATNAAPLSGTGLSVAAPAISTWVMRFEMRLKSQSVLRELQLRNGATSSRTRRLTSP